MKEKLKWYVINVILPKYAPMGAMAAVTAMGGFFAAHAGLLEQWGITYGAWPFNWASGQAPSGPCLLIELDTLSKASIAGLLALVAILARATEHHVATTIVPPVEGGLRKTDPPAVN